MKPTLVHRACCRSAWQPNPRQRIHLSKRKNCLNKRGHLTPDDPDTNELEVLVTHPAHGKCPAVRIPIFPGKYQSMLDWQVTGDLVFVIINQFRPPVTGGLGAGDG